MLAKRFVDVVFVPVAFTHVMFVRLSGAVRMRFAMVAVVAEKIVEVEKANEAFGAKRLVKVPEVEERLVTVPEEASRFVVVTETDVNEVMLPFVADKVVTPRVSIVPFEA